MAIMPRTIRRATSADADVVAEFNCRLAAESEGKELDRPTLVRGVQAILSDSTKGWYFLVERDGEILGQLMLTFEWSDWRNGWFWWIQSVYVRPDARRQGIFRSLYQHVLDLGKKQGDVIGIRLYVEKENIAAQKTYTGLGMIAPGYFVLEKCPL